MLNKRIDKIAEKYSLGYPILIESNNSYTRVTYEEKFDDELIKVLRKYKSVEYVGNCHYRYDNTKTHQRVSVTERIHDERLGKC